MSWLVSNFPALLSVASAFLGVIVLVLHMAHKDSVAQTLADVQAQIDKLQAPK